MARRRKKSKAAQAAKPREKESPMITDKSLPALPPNEIPRGAFSNDKVAPDSDGPTELSPRPRPAYTRNDSSSRSSNRPDRSPERTAETTAKDGGLSLPAPSYRNNRNSSIIAAPPDLNGGENDGFFIPVALDPSPALSTTPRSTADLITDTKKGKESDYFGGSRPTADRITDSPASTPHIAFQEKARQPSSDFDVGGASAKEPSRKLSKSSRVDNKTATRGGDENRKPSAGRKEDFKLQDAPKSKKLVSSRSNSQSTIPIENGTTKGTNGLLRKEREKSASPDLLGVSDNNTTPRSSQDLRHRDDEDTRPSVDSRAANEVKAIPRKELPSTATRNGKTDKVLCNVRKLTL
jgi:Rho-type GTPase-activating protein 1/2